MSPEKIIQFENEIFTALVIQTLKEQRATGKTDFLLDKGQILKKTSEKLRTIIIENNSN